MRILDTHLHLIYPDRFTYEWIGPGHKLNKPWIAEAYFAEARALGIESALHMEVDVAEADIESETAFVVGLSGIVGAVAACRPEDEDFAALLDRTLAAGDGKVKGLRRILHEVPDDVSLAPIFAENLKRLVPLNLTFDLCLRADQLHLGVRLAKLLPELQFVLDHCGNPDIARQGLDPWRTALAEVAALPNVVGKVSGLVNHCAPGWDAEMLRPYIEHMIESFGWDRVIWGSDHPVATTTGGTLTNWVNAARAVVAKASDYEQAALFHRNAERIYRV
ncbi:amidohydrolase family protein [Devosia aurantiaca]|uniref:Amidohydrolase family protein n=1 Tax=Devosia aurantiaca TaxID=2714858 RepID=A0A6M1SBW1_9HYPH|nr:amidohydrolase [Devosia aurantiaca]NGP17409.1 amidohydrolase family protein [Devosia aurantiaca]